MLCAFQKAPRIIRLHGRGELLLPGSDDYDELHRRFDLAAIPAAEHATRAVIRVEVERIARSCGYGEPLLAFEAHRPQAEAWVTHMLAKGEASLAAMRRNTMLRASTACPLYELGDTPKGGFCDLES
jgi:hypothetical protein